MFRKHNKNRGFWYNFMADLFDIGKKALSFMFIRSLFRRR